MLRQNAPTVTEHTFDEFHMYTLQRAATLHDQETKQVEFVRAMVASKRLTLSVTGAAIDWNQKATGLLKTDAYWNREEVGTQSNRKIWVMQEFVNSAN